LNVVFVDDKHDAVSIRVADIIWQAVAAATVKRNDSQSRKFERATGVAMAGADCTCGDAPFAHLSNSADFGRPTLLWRFFSA
jgi:hypothetical protein